MKAKSHRTEQKQLMAQTKAYIMLKLMKIWTLFTQIFTFADAFLKVNVKTNRVNISNRCLPYMAPLPLQFRDTYTTKVKRICKVITKMGLWNSQVMQSKTIISSKSRKNDQELFSFKPLRSGRMCSKVKPWLQMHGLYSGTLSSMLGHIEHPAV